MAQSTQTVLFHQAGGTEVLTYQSQDCPEPQAHEALIQHVGIGVNYIDIQHRSGRYPVAQLPAGLGIEASGVVLRVGPGEHDFKPGDRVAYLHAPGAYTQFRVMPVARLVVVPEGLSLPLVGINQGRLGFITDIPFADFETHLQPILCGQFDVDHRAHRFGHHRHGVADDLAAA